MAEPLLPKDWVPLEAGSRLFNFQREIKRGTYHQFLTFSYVKWATDMSAASLALMLLARFQVEVKPGPALQELVTRIARQTGIELNTGVEQFKVLRSRFVTFAGGGATLEPPVLVPIQLSNIETDYRLHTGFQVMLAHKSWCATIQVQFCALILMPSMMDEGLQPIPGKNPLRQSIDWLRLQLPHTQCRPEDMTIGWMATPNAPIREIIDFLVEYPGHVGIALNHSEALSDDEGPLAQVVMSFTDVVDTARTELTEWHVKAKRD